MTFPISRELEQLLSTVVVAGGHPIIVGGSVRDHLLGITPKDFDIEVFKLSLDKLESALSKNFKVDAVGRSFGVLKVTIGEHTFDVALPRRENKNGIGHRGFVVESDPNMSFADAASRRDFTMNAIGFDSLDHVFLDPWGGRKDIEARTIRHVSDHFDEDPLRVLRGCQFAARFGFIIDGATITKCQKLRPELATLPVERLWEEWKKLLLKSPRPSTGLEYMLVTEAITLFPELDALRDVPQDPEWHPEGDVWTHNNMVIDQAVRVCNDDDLDNEERLIVMLGALCHDLGKPATTKFERERWRSIDHEEQGIEPSRSFLTRIGAPPSIIEAVIPLVAHHLKPFNLFRDKASNSAIRRLALKAPLDRLCKVARADFLGRATPDAQAVMDSREIEDIVWVLTKASELKIEHEGPKPLLMGRHLVQAGIKPGKEMGQMLAKAFEAQLDGVFGDETGAVEWARTNLLTASL